MDFQCLAFQHFHVYVGCAVVGLELQLFIGSATHQNFFDTVGLEFHFVGLNAETLLEQLLFHHKSELHIVQSNILHSEGLVLEVADTDGTEIQHIFCIVARWEFQFHTDVECFSFYWYLFRFVLDVHTFNVLRDQRYLV